MAAPFTDKEQLLARIATIEADIPALDVEITQAELLLSTLRQQRQKIIHAANAYRRLLSPINKLSAEMLTEIFRFYYFDGQAGDSWVLCRVCRIWRVVAMDIPEFWSNVNLAFPTPDFTEAAIAQLQQVNPRFPAQVTISQAKKAAFPFAETLHELINAIGTLVIKDVNMDKYESLFPLVPSPRSLARNAQSTVPLLIELIPSPLPLNAKYTQLRKLCVYTRERYDLDIVGRSNFSPMRMGLPWTQLTCVNFDYGMDLEPASRSLSLCTNIRECSIALIHTGLDEDEITEPHVLMHLHTLCIVILCESDFSHFFDTLTLPALKSLILRMCEFGQDFDQTGLMELKMRSSLDLTHLATMESIFDADLLIDFLMDMPSLSSLNLFETENCITPGFMEALTLRPGQLQRLAPNLLEFAFESKRVFVYRWIIDMLESRCPSEHQGVNDQAASSASSMHCARMSFRGAAKREVWEDNLEIQRRVNALREKGMTVMLEYNTFDDIIDSAY